MDERKRAGSISDQIGEQLLQMYRRKPTSESRNRLIEHHLKLVQEAAARIAARLGQVVRSDELLSAGVFGLIEAIDNFDETRRVKFSTFSAIRIRGAMLDELRSMDPAPRRVRYHARRLEAMRQQLHGDLGRPATDHELAAALDLGWTDFCKWTRDARLAGIRRLVFAEDTGESSDRTGVSIPPDPNSADPPREAQRRMLREILLRSLSRSERLAVTLYYYEDLTMSQIGHVLDLSESRVSQMLTSVRSRLRERLGITRPHTPDELAA